MFFNAFFKIFFEANSIDFVLSSPKWMLTLLSANQSHILEESTFNCFSISSTSLYQQTRLELLGHRKRWHFTACDMSLPYIKNKSGPKIES